MSRQAGQLDYDLCADPTSTTMLVKPSNPKPGKSLMERIAEARLGRADYQREAV